MAGEMNHFDKNGNAVMVDVSGKELVRFMIEKFVLLLVI